MAKATEKKAAEEASGKEAAKAAKKTKKQDKSKKPNIFVRFGRKVKEVFSELKRVTWPTFGKAVKATGVVLVIVLIFTVIVTAVNYGFSELLTLMTSWGN